jgi:hypothetical protein
MNKLIASLLLLITIMVLIPNISRAETTILKVPENTEEAQSFLSDIWTKMKNIIPGEMERLWKQEVLPMWKKMMDVWSKWWDTSIQPWLENVWDKIMSLLGKEVEKRKPYIEEEFQKEKDEFIEEADQRIPDQGRSLWEKFKELIQ